MRDPLLVSAHAPSSSFHFFSLSDAVVVSSATGAAFTIGCVRGVAGVPRRRPYLGHMVVGIRRSHLLCPRRAGLSFWLRVHLGFSRVRPRGIHLHIWIRSRTRWRGGGFWRILDDTLGLNVEGEVDLVVVLDDSILTIYFPRYLAPGCPSLRDGREALRFSARLIIQSYSSVNGFEVSVAALSQ